MLWPLAWLWAYSKPVFHKLAYGTDKHEDFYALPGPTAEEPAQLEDLQSLRDEIDRLRHRVAELEGEEGHDRPE